MNSQLSFKPTEEQEAVIEAVGGADSVMVDAYAGCTKTTTLQMAAPRVKVPALAVAFGKKNQLDLVPRLPASFTVKTFNGLGFGAALRALPAVKATLETQKLGKLITQVGKDRKVDLSGDQWDQIRQLVTAVMQAGVTPRDRGRPLAPDTQETWAQIADDRWIPSGDFEFIYELAREVLEQGIALVERSGVFSFDDQVYFPTCIAGQFPQYPVAFVDEAQDLSPLNHKMLQLSVRPDGRLVVVGDPKQAIYAFRGADTSSMGKLRALRNSWTDRGLQTTFRCPKAIVARQQEHVPGYKAWHTNTEGVVASLRRPPEAAPEEFEGWNWARVQALLPDPRCRVAVLCRNNAPLLSLAFKLIRGRVGVVMLGRDIGKGLISLSKKLLPEDGTPRLQCSGIIAAWIEEEVGLARANGKEERVAGITDRGECLLAVIDSGCRDAGELRSMLKSLFEREAAQVELGTGHKAKGMEWDTVVHLDPWRIPSRHALEMAKAGDPRQLEQERNLRYVIETRTKHTYVQANLEDFNG